MNQPSKTCKRVFFQVSIPSVMSPTTSSIGSPSSVFSINRPIIHQDSGDNGRLKLGPVKTRNKSSRPTFDQRFSPASPENLPNIDEFEPYEPDERNLMYAFKEPTLPDTSLIGGRLLLAAWEEGLGTIHILRKHLYSTKLMPRPFTGPKMFCAGPNFLSQPKNLVPLQKNLCRHKNQFY